MSMIYGYMSHVFVLKTQVMLKGMFLKIFITLFISSVKMLIYCALKKNHFMGVPIVMQWVKELVFSLQLLGSLLRRRFNPQPSAVG